MATLRDSLVSSSARGLPLRMRPDLNAKRQQYLGRSYWVVKDPVGLTYYRFQEEEFAILQMLDGQTSLDEIKDRFEEDFPPQKITLEELQQFLGMLHRSGLVVAGVPGQGAQLLKRRRERRRKEILSAVGNVLCIRFKGFDPERFLNWLYPKVKWLFSPWAVATTMLLALSALMLVTVEFETFRSMLPGFHDFFTLKNAMWMAVTLGATKILHEFGHGLTAKHFGGECHEMGVMILVLAPCLYCNVSDSWLLPSKWRRAAIGAAGIWVELTLASVCTFLWWFSQPGFLHYTCLNVMFLSSVSTVIFNANPLLRYDGYYVLADLVEIPNLRQKATQILARKMGEWCLGLEPTEDPFLPQRRQVFFALYSIAAAVYRWVVLASILWFLYQFFKPYHLEIVGRAIIAASLISLVAVPLYKVGKFFYVPGRLDKVKKPRMAASLAVLAAVLLFVLFVPLPRSVICPLEVQARDARTVYVNLPEGGRLTAVYVRPGDKVVTGQRLAQLESLDVDQETVRLTGAAQQYERKLENLRQQRFLDPKAGNDIPLVEDALATVRKQLVQKEEDKKRLLLVAPCDGTVLPPPEQTQRDAPEGQLPFWSGSPFEPENLGAHLEERTIFCQIGDPTKFEARLIIDQTEVRSIRDLVEADKPPEVDIKLDELPHKRAFRSHIVDVANSETKAVSKRMTSKAGGEVITQTDATTGQEMPRDPSYEANAPLDDADGLLRIGLKGNGRVYTAWEPLWDRLWRMVLNTFNFRM